MNHGRRHAGWAVAVLGLLSMRVFAAETSQQQAADPRAIASSEGGTSIAMSRPKASDDWLPRAIEPTSRRTTRDCFNGPCNFFTL